MSESLTFLIVSTPILIVEALCGMLGYRQFVQEDWLENILSWQRPVEGCWSVSRYAQTHGNTLIPP